MRVAIIGASALGKQLRHLLLSLPKQFEFVGFYDDYAPEGGEVLGKTSTVVADYQRGRFDSVLIGVGYNAYLFRTLIRKRLQEARIPLATVIHPTAYVDPTAKIGEGCVLLPYVIIDQYVELGANCFLSLRASISHESKIGADTYIAPAAVICGHCTIGPSCFLGANTTVRDDTIITEGVVIGCGAVVVKNIADFGVYGGCPAKKIKVQR